jgi:hypothetical protein
VSLRGPPCALGVSGIPYGEVRDRNVKKKVQFIHDKFAKIVFAMA